MKELIRNYALQLGIDDLGFAAADDYHSPSSPPLHEIFPAAKSIIVLCYQELDNCESSNKQIAYAGRQSLMEHASSCSYKLARFLQKELIAKVMSVPISYPMDMSRGAIGEVSLRHAALAAGLGNFGLHNLIIHPRFGSRVIFNALITNLTLESDPPLTEKLCIDCRSCVDNCPAEALNEAGKTQVVHCLKNSQPYGIGGSIRFWRKFGEGSPEEQKQLLLSKDYPFLYQAASLGYQYYCFNCVMTCPLSQN